MDLPAIFQSDDLIRASLDGYAIFAEDKLGWDVPFKLRLYSTARDAWDPSIPTDKRFEHFSDVYANLRRYWKIARRGPMASAEEAFAMLDAHASGSSLHSSVDIALVNQGTQDDALMAVISSVRRVKQVASIWGSPMAMSKVLHFFNPRVFPIYDNAVVEQMALKRFRREWQAFEPDITIHRAPLHFGCLYYLKYVRWCAHLMTPVNEKVMRVFIEWVASRHPQDPGARNPINRLLSATAFEMVLIGASIVPQ